MSSPPLCALADLKIEVNMAGDATDDALLTRLTAVATARLQTVSGWRQFSQVTASAEVVRYPEAHIGGDGVLRVRLPVPRLTAVTAVAYRRHPAAAWTALDLGSLDYDPTSRRSLLRVYAGLTPSRPLWAQVSYTAGWVGDENDPYPADLQELALWWAAYLYRTKDAPFEKTANPQFGTVTIPSAMPARLKQALGEWKVTPVV